MNHRIVMAAALATVALAAGCSKAKQEAKEEPQAAPAAPAIDLAAEEKAIRDKSAAWMNYANAKDTASVLKMYSPDVVTAYDGTVQRGVAEVQAGAESGIKENPDQVVAWSTSAVRVAKSGDLAVETGNITVDPDGAAGKKPARNGVFVTVWEKVDGDWRVAYDSGTENEKKDAAAGD